jgi:hypothetical protein
MDGQTAQLSEADSMGSFRVKKVGKAQQKQIAMIMLPQECCEGKRMVSPRVSILLVAMLHKCGCSTNASATNTILMICCLLKQLVNDKSHFSQTFVRILLPSVLVSHTARNLILPWHIDLIQLSNSVPDV